MKQDNPLDQRIEPTLDKHRQPVRTKKVYHNLCHSISNFDFLPYRCVLCDSPSEGKTELCQKCLNQLPLLNEPRCQYCALPLCGHDALFCADCLQSPPGFSYSIILGEYRFPLDQMVQRLKYHKALVMGRVLGEQLAERVRQEVALQQYQLPEVIIPVPIHWHRHWSRGFNQSVEIARPAGRQLGIPVNYRYCRRLRNQQRQQGSGRKQRKANLNNTFFVKSKEKYRHVAIVDDVVTTTATARALARTLSLNGIKRIDLWAIARTPKSA